MRATAFGAKRTLVPAARTTDHKEAVRAFIDKRKPTFVGQLVFVACACECCCIV
jgi:hypothetical protein